MSNEQEKVWAVYEMPTREARIFMGKKPQKVSEAMTNKDAHEYCQHLSQCGYYDERIKGYDVMRIK